MTALSHSGFHFAQVSLKRLPRRYAPTVFALLMSSVMSAIMSASITLINTGLAPGFANRWLGAWGLAFSIAFPLVSLLAPRVRWIVDRITG